MEKGRLQKMYTLKTGTFHLKIKKGMTISQVISQFLAVLGKGSCDSFAQGLSDCDCGGSGGRVSFLTL